MGVRATVDLVFGIDMPALEWSKRLDVAIAAAPSVGLAWISGEGARPRDGAVLYARASEVTLCREYDVPVPVLDVATVGVGVDRDKTIAWAEALRAFAMANDLSMVEPRWLVVTNVC